MIEFILPTSSKAIIAAVVFIAIWLYDHFLDKIVNKLSGHFSQGLNLANSEIDENVEKIFDKKETFTPHDVKIIITATFAVRFIFAYICACFISLF
jgi:hypothetical protein